MSATPEIYNGILLPGLGVYTRPNAEHATGMYGRGELQDGILVVAMGLGPRGDHTGVPEAQVARGVFEDNGIIDKVNFLTEERSTNTFRNVLGLRKILEENEQTLEGKNIGVVSAAPHSARFILIAERLFPDTTFRPIDNTEVEVSKTNERVQLGLTRIALLGTKKGDYRSLLWASRRYSLLTAPLRVPAVQSLFGNRYKAPQNELAA